MSERSNIKGKNACVYAVDSPLTINQKELQRKANVDEGEDQALEISQTTSRNVKTRRRQIGISLFYATQSMINSD